MAPYWRMVSTIMGGAGAMRAAGEAYLPKFPDESDARYEFRRANAKFTNVFRDILENLAQRPFSKRVQIVDGAPEAIEGFIDDVDGCGNHLHVFAGDVFFAGLAAAVDWILVDYTKGVPGRVSRAQERAIGARPYWVRYPADSVLAAHSDMIDGREQFVHVRLLEPETRRDGWKETTVNRVRILDRQKTETGYAPATWEVWEEVKGQHGGSEWVLVEGPEPITIGVIPLVPFVTGRRVGTSWRFHPPMRDAAELQIELFQQESALKHAKALTAFPMLAGNGVEPPIGDDGKPLPVPVGPHGVLFAPPGDKGAGSWQFIEPSATSLRFLADDIKETISQLRELGRQPLTAQSGNLTVVTTAFAAQKGNAAIQAWAWNLKDALENALTFTALWLGEAYDPEVTINTDFDLGFGDDDSFAHIMALATGEEPLISRAAAIHEAKRRGILDTDYDGDEDLQALLAETGALDDEET